MIRIRGANWQRGRGKVEGEGQIRNHQKHKKSQTLTKALAVRPHISLLSLEPRSKVYQSRVWTNSHPEAILPVHHASLIPRPSLIIQIRVLATQHEDNVNFFRLPHVSHVQPWETSQTWEAFPSDVIMKTFIWSILSNVSGFISCDVKPKRDSLRNVFEYKLLKRYLNILDPQKADSRQSRNTADFKSICSKKRGDTYPQSVRYLSDKASKTSSIITD